MSGRNTMAARLAALERRLDWIDDRQAIHDVLCRYCRAIDRLDGELLRSVFWPDARVDLGAGLYQGEARDFFDFALQFQGAMKVTRHELGNVLIERHESGAAFAESYVYAFHVVEQERRLQDLIVYGRYLDRFEQRDGEWRIGARTEVIDWAHERAATEDWFGRQPPLHRGSHDMRDEVYRLLQER